MRPDDFLAPQCDACHVRQTSHRPHGDVRGSEGEYGTTVRGLSTESGRALLSEVSIPHSSGGTYSWRMAVRSDGSANGAAAADDTHERTAATYGAGHVSFRCGSLDLRAHERGRTRATGRLQTEWRGGIERNIDSAGSGGDIPC